MSLVKVWPLVAGLNGVHPHRSNEAVILTAFVSGWVIDMATAIVMRDAGEVQIMVEESINALVPAGSPAPVIPPLPVHAVVESVSPSIITLTMDAGVSVADMSGFSVTGVGGTTGIISVNATLATITVTISGGVGAGETVTLDYDSAQTSDLSSLADPSVKVASFSQAVINNVV